jgi:hypothetical protein
MPETNSQGRGETLLRRLRRATARASAVGANDQAQLLALLSDIETIRKGLSSECARLDEEINRAAVRVAAITAYARGARSVRGPCRGGH